MKNFKTLCKNFCLLWKKPQWSLSDIHFFQEVMEVPLIVDACTYLGIEKMVRLNYAECSIREQVIEKLNKVKSVDIKKELDYSVGLVLNSEEVLNDLQRVYTKLGIDYKPNCRDIDFHYKVRYRTLRGGTVFGTTCTIVKEID